MLKPIEKHRLDLTLLVGFIAVSLLIYSPTLNHFFLSDDFDRIYNIQKNGIFGVWTTAPEIFFRPIISITLFIDYVIWKLNPIGYHLSNVTFHAVCSFFVYILASLLLNKTWLKPKQIRLISIISGCIFLTLHSHVEAVVWISARADIVVTFFSLSAFCFYLLYIQSSSKLYYLIVSYLLFLGGLFSKESALIFPGFIFLYEASQLLTTKIKLNSVYKAFYFPLFYSTAWLIYFPLRYLGLGKFLGGYGSGVHLNFNGWVIFQGLASSLRVIIPPLSLSTPIYWKILFLLFLGGIILFIKSCYQPARFSPDIAKISIFLTGSFLLSVLPFLSMGVSIVDTQSERFLYFSSAFLSILLALILGVLLINRQFFCILLITCFSIFSINQIYLSSQTWRVASQVSKQTIESLKSLKENQGMFIMNLPDNYKGAYIYRNGFYPAVQLFCPFVNVDWFIVASFQNLLNPTDEVEVTGITSHEYRITLLNPETYFINVPELLTKNREIDGFELSSLDYENYRSYTLKIKDNVRLHRIFYYTNKRLKRVLT
ncbi:hypothetical protein ACL6C3_29735 [Capilliphycus salinus ALCB114379]|uniref:hypothetical protein n=1 Tax=Capilliphycus salinus TaxID=2768948 RepID=UPI0039A50680